MKSLLFATSLSLLLFVISPTFYKVHAYEEYQEVVLMEEQTVTPEPTPVTDDVQNQATSSVTVKYDLAYPGMLPDNPLYKLKQLRDKIAAGLISDPKKKVEFYLLMADKGILASAMLVDKKNVSLAKDTALKAEHNMTLLTYQLGRFPKKLDDSLYQKLKQASLKHQEVLTSLSKRVSKKDKDTFDKVIEFSKRNWETIDKFQKSEVIVK